MKKIGLVGAGTMGQGIILTTIQSNCDVFVYESDDNSLNRAQQNLRKYYDKEILKSRVTEALAREHLAKVHFVKNIQELFACEVVVEAIIEDPQAKRELFSLLSSVVSDNCILATNTSSLSISSLASVVRNPERFIGIHFFNPAHLMKLVEVIPAIQTSDETVHFVKNLLLACNKIPVIAKDTPGFIVNRIARPYYGEALKIYEEGIAEPVDIDFAMTQTGFKMGPFALMDFIGNDINFQVTEIVYNSFFQDPKYRPSFTQKRLVEAGYFGVKTGRGFYSYAENANRPIVNITPADAQYISDRIVIMLINEAVDALFFNIATKEDIEISMTKGVNYPKGLLRWADDFGIEECVKRMDDLFNVYHDTRYRCSPLLRKMTKLNQKFY